MIKSIAVFCGSKTGSNSKFSSDAEALGKLLASKNVQLIYGGGSVGLMGIVANAVLQGGGQVVGVIPGILDKLERSHKTITELLIVDDMHARKKKMYERCEAAVILPGGYGTMDELFEMITWNNLSIHDKKIFILNTGNYYDSLIKQIRAMYENGFLYEDPSDNIVVLNDPFELSEFL